MANSGESNASGVRVTSPAGKAAGSRRRVLQALSAALALGLAPAGLRAQAAAAAPATCGAWPAWEVLAASSLQADGRVVDASERDRRSTSEGQSYALFFALVDGDQARFDRILQWTQDNLAGGDLGRRLPAWRWGLEEKSGRWQVLDSNSASDADLWLAYTLIEAGRLWGRPALADTGQRLLAQVRAAEVADLPGLGPMLLPGAQGFAAADHWRLNPSYLPLPLLRRFAEVDRQGPWKPLAVNTLTMVEQSAPHGFAPDWVAWKAGRCVADPDKGALGSYDAIRVYLWAGMTDAGDPLRKPLLRALDGPWKLLQQKGAFAERIDTATGAATGTAPYGFNAALLPYLHALGQPQWAQRLQRQLPTPEQQRQQAPAYYAQMLNLFGSGWMEGRYRFRADGRLLPAWSRCRRR